MSCYINLVPEYQDENGVWHPILEEKFFKQDKYIYYQCNMRDCLRDEGHLVNLTNEEKDIFRGTYISQVPEKDENGTLHFVGNISEYDYTKYVKAITLDELYELSEKEKAQAIKYFNEDLSEYTDAVKSLELAKVVSCSKNSNEIPSHFSDDIREARATLMDCFDDYSLFDNYVSLVAHINVLSAFGHFIPNKNIDKKLRYLFYMM